MKGKSWWDLNIPNKDTEEIFRGWVGDKTAVSRQYFKDYIKDMDIDTVLECGCAYAVDSELFEELGIDYSAIEYADVFVKDCKSRGLSVIQGDIENIPYEDDKFDLVYSRHVIEHLPYFTKALKEMIRVSKRDIIIILFIKLQDQEQIVYTPEMDIHHNRYGKQEMLKFVASQGCDCKYLEINEQEALFHIRKLN